MRERAVRALTVEHAACEGWVLVEDRKTLRAGFNTGTGLSTSLPKDLPYLRAAVNHTIHEIFHSWDMLNTRRIGL